MINRSILYILLVFWAFPALAQEEFSDTLDVDTVQRDAAVAYKLFSPLTYDRSVTNSFFLINEDTTSLIDRTKMRLYLQHPENVILEKPALKSSTKASDNDIIIPVNNVSMVQKMKEINKSAPVTSKPVTDDSVIDDKISLVVTKPNFWKFYGDYSLQFMQNYISPNWYNSGNSNYSMLGAVTLQYNYNNKQKVKWENKLEMRLGFLTTEADSVNKFKTSDDLLRYTTQLSLQAHKKWYYAMQAIVSTQFSKGLKNNDSMIYSDFMSPLNMNVSLGMNYSVDVCHSKLTGNILLSPISYKLTYCDRSDIVTRFGIEEGKHSLSDFGALLNVDVTWKPLENFKWQSRLYTYFAYTKQYDSAPQKFQLEWENTFTFQFNRYVSAKLYIYPRFDNSVTMVDNTYWQLKENFSLGFNYTM